MNPLPVSTARGMWSASRADGAVNFFGRADHQVKIRGFRIELGEIESRLRQHPAVSQAVVKSHQQQLVAYLIFEDASEVASGDLRRFVQESLPAYMVPYLFMPLAQFPLTPNGKVDRQALPDPSGERDAVTEYVAPRTQTEQAMAEIWQNLLKVAEISIHDNFFELGGHSLLAAQLVSAMSRHFGKTIPLRLLFDAPTIVELTYQLQTLTDETTLEPIPKRPFSQPIPLSFAQQRLWFIEQMNSQANASYNIPIHFMIQGELDLAALEYSFNQLLQRHESLRTRYVVGDDEIPYQEIMPVTAVPLPFTDLSALAALEKEEKAQQIRRQNAQTPFDLENGPIYRCHILQTEEKTYQLLFTVHHIAFDAWSIDLFLREVMAHYLHKTTGMPLALSSIDTQFADYTIWQQERLTPEFLAQQLDFWRNHLAHAPLTIELPLDKPRPQWQTSNGNVHRFVIPAEIAADVKQLAQTEQATLFMTLFAAFNSLLYRYTNQEDIVVGTPIANRNHPDLANIIGFFLNTLALRSHIEETTTWHELLQQTRQTMLAAHDNQEYPFENLVQAILPDRDPSRSPLFQVMFVLQNRGDNEPLPANLPIQISQMEGSTNTAKFDLLLDVQETDNGFIASLEYNTDLFHASTISRMAEHFQQLVAAMAAQPSQLISQANLLTQQEQIQIERWNDTAATITETQLVHHRFEQQADAKPQAIAVEFGAHRMTYMQLETRANQLAHFLQTNGIGPNDLVGILLPRSLDMVTAVLAILKVGAGYVPLDPTYPTTRLEVMMQQAEVNLLLTHSTLSHTEMDCPCYDVDTLALDSFDTGRITAVIPPTQAVYVIYTSGSTGQPKGVILPHRALDNLLSWQRQATHLKQPARTLQFTSLSFDVHFQEIFTTWQEGGTLVLIPDDVRRDGEQLLAYIQTHQIERLFLPFVALHNLAEAAQWAQSYPNTLREIITAGEALQATPAIRELFTQLPHCVLHNQYGPSESHVVTQHTLSDDPTRWPALPSIGKPVANTQIHLLDTHLKPVPIGISGELYIGGHNLALGYINQPQLTADRFISNPFSANPEARLYKNRRFSPLSAKR
ncbi:MAG: amino acid adenylation domain-containing protein [Chloroflexi bacterium]|nr:amino acid adenylation domain-containing protein [Chloroflexota bacterium]